MTEYLFQNITKKDLSTKNDAETILISELLHLHSSLPDIFLLHGVHY